MTDESPSPSPDESQAPSSGKHSGRPAKVRRISNPRPGKSAPREITTALTPEAETPPAAHDAAGQAEAAESPTTNSDWPSAPDEISRQETPHNKRGNNRRRKKGKGNAQSPSGTEHEPETSPEDDAETEAAEASSPTSDSAENPQPAEPSENSGPQASSPPPHSSQSPRPPREERERDRDRDRDRDRERERDRQSPQPNRSRHDPETVGKCAWKIYLAEISEEGVALVTDHDARELARRCFRLAEIFLDEQARRR